MKHMLLSLAACMLQRSPAAEAEIAGGEPVPTPPHGGQDESFQADTADGPTAGYAQADGTEPADAAGAAAETENVAEEGDGGDDSE